MHKAKVAKAGPMLIIGGYSVDGSGPDIFIVPANKKNDLPPGTFRGYYCKDDQEHFFDNRGFGFYTPEEALAAVLTDLNPHIADSPDATRDWTEIARKIMPADGYDMVIA